jgi:hypothetical protein
MIVYVHTVTGYECESCGGMWEVRRADGAASPDATSCSRCHLAYLETLVEAIDALPPPTAKPTPIVPAPPVATPTLAAQPEQPRPAAPAPQASSGPNMMNEGQYAAITKLSRLAPYYDETPDAVEARMQEVVKRPLADVTYRQAAAYMAYLERGTKSAAAVGRGVR